jgi:S1/P1 Nuclease
MMVRSGSMTSRRFRLALLFGAALGLVASRARAWGDEGHRAIGELAYRLAATETRAALDRLLTDPSYTTLADAATWPDTHARRFREYDAMRVFHFVNVPPASAAYSRARDCEQGCIVTALEQHMALLGRGEALTASERRFSLYWVAHLMGDLHQPLHVAHPDGRGGNRTLLPFFDEPERKSAHWIWDSGLIERRPPPSPRVSDAVATDQPSYRALADALGASLTPAEVRRYQRTLAPELIVNEVFAVARRAAFLRESEHVDAAYERATWPVVEEQLKRAAARLAAALDRALRRQ